LIKQIQALPPDRIAEIEDFVAFIVAREHERSHANTNGRSHATPPPLARRFSPRSGTIRRTTFITTCEFGDVVLVPFPFTNQLVSKKRPAVVVSGVTYNRARRDVVVMAITSQFSQRSNNHS
jgi:hypothetical protein